MTNVHLNSVVDVDILFTGQRFDTHTNLQLFRMRWFDSITGRFGSRDELAYPDGPNAYTAWFVPNALDSFGLRAIEFDFAAFIDDRFGTWLLEPGTYLFHLLQEYWYQGDNRKCGQAGTSRIQSTGSIESRQIGGAQDANGKNTPGLSHRGHWVGTFHRRWVVDEKRTQLLVDYVKVSSTRDLSSSPPRCTTVVEFKVEGDYPFIAFGQGTSLVPHIDYDVRFEFTVIGKNRVSVTLSGVHDAFPSYDSNVDKKCIYCNYTGFSGPGYLSLGGVNSLNFASKTWKLSAETAECCSD